VTRLEIRSNPLLARAIVFERLSRLGAFLLSGNASLRVAPAFPLVTSADGDIAIYDNPQLESLTGFASLISSNGLSILRNPRLVELDLGQLRETSTSLTIFENPGLDGAALAASLAPVASSMHRVAPDQNVANQNPCPWTSDPLCDEGWGHCAPGTDPVCE
jgi:hypothetical protein